MSGRESGNVVVVVQNTANEAVSNLNMFVDFTVNGEGVTVDTGDATQGTVVQETADPASPLPRFRFGWTIPSLAAQSSATLRITVDVDGCALGDIAATTGGTFETSVGTTIDAVGFEGEALSTLTATAEVVQETSLTLELADASTSPVLIGPSPLPDRSTLPVSPPLHRPSP